MFALKVPLPHTQKIYLSHGVVERCRRDIKTEQYDK